MAIMSSSTAKISGRLLLLEALIHAPKRHIGVGMGGCCLQVVLYFVYWPEHKWQWARVEDMIRLQKGVQSEPLSLVAIVY